MTTTIDIKSGHPEPWHRHQVVLYAIGKKDPEITFRAEEHRYFWRDRELPSVTKILGSKGPKFYTPGSAWRGEMVHKMTTLYVQGVLDEKTLDPRWNGYLSALKKFLAAIGKYQVLGVEEVVGDASLGFAGRRDLVIEYDGGPSAIALYLSAKGTYTADAIRGNFTALKGEAINKIVEYYEKGRLTL